MTLKKKDVCNLWLEEEVIKNIGQATKSVFHIQIVGECYP